MERATPEPEVLYEDNHLLVIAKPAGMLSQDDHTEDLSVVVWAKRYLKERYAKPGNVYLGLVHRLDRRTSGAMVLARTSKAATRLARAFREHRVQKRYWALVEGDPGSEGRWRGYLEIPAGNRPVRVHAEPAPERRPAETAWRRLATDGTTSLLELVPYSGRKHQLRAQAAAAGVPILGDHRYGARRPWHDGALALHARALTVPHPIGGRPHTWLAPLPAAWSRDPRIRELVVQVVDVAPAHRGAAP